MKSFVSPPALFPFFLNEGSNVLNHLTPVFIAVTVAPNAQILAIVAPINTKDTPSILKTSHFEMFVTF
jgi:hypothetical protein